MAPNLIYLDKERTKRRGDTRMTGAEKLDELVWLLDGGTHPTFAARQLGTTVGALIKLAKDHGRPDLAKRIPAAGARADAPGKHWRAA